MFFKVDAEKLKNVKTPRDHCVLCGAETSYTENTPVSRRAAYVEGAGQLCCDCYRNLYYIEAGGYE